MKKKIGEIELGDVAFLSDPCYGTDCRSNTTMNVLAGKYNVYITRSESKSPYIENRISNIFVVHKEIAKTYKKMPTDDKDMLMCAVDSGTCGIFDYEYYKKHHTENDVEDNWYEENVIKMEEFKVTDNLGAISSSGLGDGLYPVFAEYKNDKAFAIRIKFL